MRGNSESCRNIKENDGTDNEVRTLSKNSDILSSGNGTWSKDGILSQKALSITDNELSAIIWKNLESVMKYRNISNSEMAKIAGTRPCVVRSWKNGYRMPMLDKLYRISRTLKYPIDFFFKERKTNGMQ